MVFGFGPSGSGRAWSQTKKTIGNTKIHKQQTTSILQQPMAERWPRVPDNFLFFGGGPNVLFGFGPSRSSRAWSQTRKTSGTTQKHGSENERRANNKNKNKETGGSVPGLGGLTSPAGSGCCFCCWLGLLPLSLCSLLFVVSPSLIFGVSRTPNV